jgi:hypothetical protein
VTNPRFFWTAVLALAAVTLAGAGVSAFGPERIALTAPDLQERVNQALPRQFRNVTVDRATVTLADGRIAVRSEVHVAAGRTAVAAAITARGVPQYDAGRGEVFFDADQVRIEDSGSGGIIKQLTGLRIGGKVAEDAAAGLVGGSIKAWLAARPVYRFKDDIKGVVFRATLKDVAIDGDRLVITVSLIRLSAAAAAWLGGLALVVLGAAWFWARGRMEEEFGEPAKGRERETA